ncbi:MAG: gliding motility associated protein GldN [Flavobacteriaceae bacterium]|jgi:gliding motility associated protien GldN
MKYIHLLFWIMLSQNSFAQDTLPGFGPLAISPTGQLNGSWLNENVLTKRAIPYPSAREADVLWSKRIWRALDMRERLNHTIYYPLDEVTPYGWIRNANQWSLWTIIRKHVMNGDLQVFSPYNPVSYGLGTIDGDQLKYPILPEPGKDFYSDLGFRDEMVYFLGHLGQPGTVPLVDPYGEPIVDVINGVETYRYDDPDTMWYNSEDIVEYRLKEDWFFDKARSEMDVRIIAIAPVVYDYEFNSNGEKTIRGKKELFWLYFPHCRAVFNNYYVYNGQNDAYPMSFDDLFWKRRFSSYIYKESNAYDREIDTYRHGIDAIHESDAITDGIRTFEHDLWSF